MGQFEIVKDVSTTLQKLLETSLKNAGYKDVELYTAIPTEENIKKLPALSLFLSAVCIDPIIRERGQKLMSVNEEESGEIIEYSVDPPLLLKLYYTVSAWGKTPQEEHVLLALAIKVFYEHPEIGEGLLQGYSFRQRETIALRPVEEPKFGYEETMSFWRSMGEKIRPSAQFCVWAYLDSDRRSDPIRQAQIRNAYLSGLGRKR
ncbi:MAG: Pvc16 family protein [Bradymonadales bacterium]